ncbi:hypothetical protein EJ110_NYTH05518 [Nymphaea thermarum]|nr:hypothetical protein EJ110_NYTH05518 [Nymphaea thermarum]
MVHLFLSQTTCDDDNGDIDINAGAASGMASLLEELGSLLWQVIVANGRAESRLWLCSTIASINSIGPREQWVLFRKLLESSSHRRRIAAQVLQLVFEKKPREAGKLLAKKCYMLEKFFSGNPGRILQWFGNFATSGKYEHQKGARAISQYAFINRDVCWEELEWKGKHGQSPAMVATKPHYFLDLDVLRTVENFLENVPDFWVSNELAETLKDGEIFRIDMKFFTDQFTHLMYEENAADVWAFIDEFLNDEQFSNLCNLLLILLNENELSEFMIHIHKVCSNLHSKVSWQTEKFQEPFSPSFWLEILLLTSPQKLAIDELLLSNAVINHGRQLLRLVQSDEHIEEKDKINEILSKVNRIRDEAQHWSLMKECTKINRLAAMKLLGLESWVVHSHLALQCKSSDSWESFFLANGIGFRKSATFSLVGRDGSSHNGGSRTGDSSSARVPRNIKKRHRKKRKKYPADYDHSSSDELTEITSSTRWEGLGSDGCWLISTDTYSSPWSSVCISLSLILFL